MSLSIEVLLNPADYQTRAAQGFAGQVCVVFDVLRATSVMVTGLGHGAAGFIPVEEISEALLWHEKEPETLLAGERDGLRITRAQSGGVDFDLGNSPREFASARVAGRTIITTTTNGTRALRACASAETVAVGSFLNLAATARWVVARAARHLVLVCAGTGEAASLEDILGAGALCDQLATEQGACNLDDAALIARRLYGGAAGELLATVSAAKNGRRLLANPDLREDVAFCLRRDVFDLVGVRGDDGVIRSS